MVAVIKTGHAIRRAFHYNENKIKEGVAECIGAGNYLREPDEMNENQRLNRLLNQAALNQNVKRNSVHISLNFAPGEELSKDRLNEIAGEYMERIGFKDQPFLVYQHHDAGHPHLHIVTTKIRSDGSRIDTQNIGRNQSEEARKAIEKKYGLVRAEDQKRQEFELKPINIQKVLYGRSQTRRAIQNVLESVLKSYKYTSLPELNAILHQYNVSADRGSENSRIFKNNGLVYRVLNDDGKPVGVPIKASDFYSKPTLKFLEKQFETGKVERQKHRSRIKNTIDLALKSKHGEDLDKLILALKKEGIHTVLRANQEGLIYGITFVDHRTKCVFNGSALGKNYSAKTLQQRCADGPVSKVALGQTVTVTPPLRDGRSAPKQADTPHQIPENIPALKGKKGLLEEFVSPEKKGEYLPFEWRKRKKKKRKRL
jgi:hypothetical protein